MRHQIERCIVSTLDIQHEGRWGHAPSRRGKNREDDSIAPARPANVPVADFVEAHQNVGGVIAKQFFDRL